MRPTLLESDRSFLHSAELVTLSIAVHVTALVFVADPKLVEVGAYKDQEEAKGQPGHIHSFQ